MSSLVVVFSWLLAAASLGAGDPAPTTLDLVTLEGRRTMVGIDGQVTVVNFFATWSPRARDSIAGFSRVVAQHGGRARFVAVDVQEKPMVVKRFLAKYPLAGDVIVAIDASGAAARQFGAKSLPFTFVLDQHGIVRYAQRGWGEGSVERLNASIARLLDGPPRGYARAPAGAPAKGLMKAAQRGSKRGRGIAPASGGASPAVLTGEAGTMSDDEHARRMGVEVLR